MLDLFVYHRTPNVRRNALVHHRFLLPSVFLIAVLYASILYRLIAQWATDPNFSYCFVIPAFSVFILWHDRNKLASIQFAPSWSGLIFIVLAMAMLVVGQLGVELFTSRLSLLVLLAGVIILFRGWSFFRAVLFPWSFLVLMIPLPNLILQRITFPLQILASKISTFVLEGCRVPVLREGNVIVLAAKRLQVAQACSGIHSLLSLVTLAIVYGYLTEKRTWARAALVGAAVPIALFDNSARIIGTALLVQYWDPDKAEGFVHQIEGFVVFAVSLILLMFVHRLMKLIWKDNTSSRVSPPDREEAEGGAVQVADSDWRQRFVLMAIFLVGTAVGLYLHSRDEILPPRDTLSSLPLEMSGWKVIDKNIDEPTREILGPGDFLERSYEDRAQREPWIDLFVAYFPTQKVGDTVHSPNHCLPGAGWVPISRQLVQLTRADGTSFSANRYVISKADQQALVLYWYDVHGRIVTSDYLYKYHLVSDSIRMHRSDGALVRLMSPMLGSESPDAAQERIMRLASHILVSLARCIPK